MVLGFEIGGLDTENTVEGGSGRAGKGGEARMRAEELGEARGGECGLGRDVEGGAG